MSLITSLRYNYSSPLISIQKLTPAIHFAANSETSRVDIQVLKNLIETHGNGVGFTTLSATQTEAVPSGAVSKPSLWGQAKKLFAATSTPETASGLEQTPITRYSSVSETAESTYELVDLRPDPENPNARLLSKYTINPLGEITNSSGTSQEIKASYYNQLVIEHADPVSVKVIVAELVAHANKK
jgi:hypothetical protein